MMITQSYYYRHGEGCSQESSVTWGMLQVLEKNHVSVGFWLSVVYYFAHLLNTEK